MSLSKENRENIFEKALNKYLKCLKEWPLLTKSCTSGTVSGLGNYLSQIIAPSADKSINWRSVMAYASFGFFLSAPIIHNFYIYLEKFSPRKEKSQLDAIKRLIIDRFIFTPPFILMFLYVMPLMEGQSSAMAIKRIKEFYWTLLKMNWKVWTIFTYINVNYIPVKYRVLFGNIVGLFWSIYVAVKRRQGTL